MNKETDKSPIRVYISGPITGRNFRKVCAEFYATDLRLSLLGFEVVNPLNNEVPIFSPHSAYMKADIARECTCDRIYYIRNWRRWFSLGVWQERFVAWSIGLPKLREKEVKKREAEQKERNLLPENGNKNGL